MSSPVASSTPIKSAEPTFTYPYCDDVAEKYEKVSRIGKGTFGEVFRAKNRKTNKEVALKRIIMENENEGFPITALREIKLLRQFKDDNVVNLIEVCRAQPDPHGKATSYLVFDFCHHDLAGLIQENHDKIRHLPVIKCIVYQLLDGLLKLHSYKIIHRDMKSSNILITKDGQLKIADFGLARPFSQSGERKYTNRVVTLWYRPPELLLGERNYGGAVDVWGVGCIMSELFTKEPIMKGDTEQRQLQLISEFMGPISPEVWPSVVQLPLYKKLSNLINNPKQQKRMFVIRLKRHTHDELALDLMKKLLTLDPSKRIEPLDALDHDFFWDDRDPLPANKTSVVAEALSSITTSSFEYTARCRKLPQPANPANYQMVNRNNNHRPISHGHRPGPSNHDGQYRDHVY